MCLYTTHSFIFVNDSKMFHRRQPYTIYYTRLRDYVSLIRHIIVNEFKSPDFRFNRIYYKQEQTIPSFCEFFNICVLFLSPGTLFRKTKDVHCVLYFICIFLRLKKLSSAFTFYTYRKPVSLKISTS